MRTMLLSQPMTMGNYFSVSVAIITYNQENYIDQALDSVLQQQTNFSFNVVISDDASNDQTPKIISRHTASNPSNIDVLYRAKNVGAGPNFIETLDRCRGKYIAYLEGDDYWLDSRKLQKQFDYMESHPEIAMCFSSAREINESRMIDPTICGPSIKKTTFNFKDILTFNCVPSCTIFFRREILAGRPVWFDELGTDTALCLLAALHGDLGYINEPLAVRRIHGMGAWGGLTHEQYLRKSIEYYSFFRRKLGNEYSAYIDNLQMRQQFRLAVDMEWHGKRAESWKIFKTNWQKFARNPHVTRGALAKLIAKYCMIWRMGSVP